MAGVSQAAVSVGAKDGMLILPPTAPSKIMSVETDRCSIRAQRASGSYGDTFRVKKPLLTMCGIAGYCRISMGGQVDSGVFVRRMTRIPSRIAGPDDEGVHVEPGVGLGHRRLAILDLSRWRSSADGHAGRRSLWITYNGEIYNFRELRRELEQHWLAVHGRSQTRKCCCMRIASGATSAGESVLKASFALALWNRPERTLHLVA